MKDALMTTIEAEFAKNPKDPSYQPTRFSRAEAAKMAAASAGRKGDAAKGELPAGVGYWLCISLCVQHEA
jgi:hypothetical protein